LHLRLEEEQRMPETPYAKIDGEELARKLERTAPNNEHRREGFALVNVLERTQFERARIPGSANIPHGEEDSFEKRFDKEKEIIVYCASPQCDASEKAARELARRGFRRVVEYEAGLRGWQESGHAVVGSGA
jgi:rhodanese-related sulfurtransferase